MNESNKQLNLDFSWSKGHMKRYIALLRGINVSGKNKIAMTELKEGFADISARPFPKPLRG